MRRARLILTIAVTAAAAQSAGLAQAPGRATSCPPRGLRVLQQGTQVVLFTNRAQDGTIIGCRRPDGPHIELQDSRTGVPPPAIAIYGSLVATAFDEGIVIERLPRHGREPVLDPFGVAAQDIGPIVLKADGAIAWITCLSDDFASPTGPAPCARKHLGAVEVNMFEHKSLAFRRPLATYGLGSGRTIAGSTESMGPGFPNIDPRSLRLWGSTVTWTQGGTRHHATLY